MTGTVWLLAYPVELGMSTVEHIEDWMREFQLMALGREAGTATSDVPQRLQTMVETLTRRYGAQLSEPDRVRAAENAGAAGVLLNADASATLAVSAFRRGERSGDATSLRARSWPQPGDVQAGRHRGRHSPEQ